MKEYNTKQKEMLLNFLKENGHSSYTSEEMLQALPGMSKSTLYRLLGHLEEEGALRCSMKDRSRTYSLIEKECLRHLHLKCRKCGQSMHLSEEATAEIIRIIENEACFLAAAIDVEVTGLCRECRK